MNSLVLFWLVTLTLLPPGCATSGVDWNRQVGRYTYDQAVEDMGIPTIFSMTSDNSIVAEWLTKRGYSGPIERSAEIPRSNPPYSFRQIGPSAPAPGVVEAQSRFLKLVFGPDLKLRSWEKVNR